MSSQWEEGCEGEGVIRDYLHDRGYHYFQADIITRIDGKWHLLEIKKQEMFEKPPFDGHGLPSWQIEARLRFQEETGIRAMLFVVDKKTGVVYWQYMDILMSGEKLQTKGDKPRMIFPLSNYRHFGGLP